MVTCARSTLMSVPARPVLTEPSVSTGLMDTSVNVPKVKRMRRFLNRTNVLIQNYLAQTVIVV